MFREEQTKKKILKSTAFERKQNRKWKQLKGISERWREEFYE